MMYTPISHIWCNIEMSKVYKCTVDGCGKEFNRPDHLEQHSRVHTNVRPYACDKCDKKFKQSSHLKSHMFSHTDERPFVCQVEGCSSKFKTAEALGIHKSTHSLVRPFVCETCSMTFKSSRDLYKHEVTHKERKKFECDVDNCKAVFNSPQGLNYHKFSHSGLRPYACTKEECNATFRTLYDLNIHSRIHSGVRPFSCTYSGCNSTFTQKSHLTGHLRSHSGEKPFVCTTVGCSSKFACSSSLTYHIKTWHTTEGQVRKKKYEARILKILTQNEFEFKPQHMIDFTCVGDDREGSRCFIDFLVECKDDQGKTKGIVFLEVDEYQHSHYDVSCELRRMTDVHRSLIMEGNTIPITFVRYNPHAFKVDDKTKRTLLKVREERLVQFLNEMIFDKDFQVSYLFYDITEDVPTIFQDASYDETFKTLVTNVIV